MSQLQDTATLICEFLEVAFHTLLYVREVYPPDLFERRRKYTVPVRQSRNPELNTYITEVVASMRPWLARASLNKVILEIRSPHHEPVERFVFTFSLLEQQAQSPLELEKIEASFRAFILKINVVDALLPPVPKGSSFVVLVVTDGSAEASTQDWVLDSNSNNDSNNNTNNNNNNNANGSNNSEMIPLKTLDSGCMRVNLFAEKIASAAASSS